MPSPYNITNIPAPRVDFIDSRTGLMAREWYRFFFNLFNLTGAGTTDTSLADLQMGPPAINEVLGELGITYDQAQLASMMAEYEQATRDIQNRLDTAPASPQLGTLAAVNEDNVRLIGFSTNPSPAVPVPAPTGTLYWDGNSTLGLQMNQGVLAKIGQSQFTYVKASAAITKGQLCKHTGSVGSSGVITAAPTSIGMTDPNQIVGVAAEDIALNAFGFIQDSGDLRGFDTTGSSVGEVWADGDSLYYNPAYVGSFTKVKPSAPNLKIYIGEVINAGAGSSGSINIRMSPGSVLGGTDSNVQFGTLADKDLIQYDSTAQYWKNVAASSISIGTATNLAGGAAGSVPYQTAPSTTTFLSIGSAGQYARVNAGATAPEWASPRALTKTDDTNVTLTLGGSASTALLNAASITVGWTGTLGVTRGGTGTGTAFTAGSVIFAGASGVYSQDNANLFWDSVNKRLGINSLAAPAYNLHVYGDLSNDGIVYYSGNAANNGFLAVGRTAIDCYLAVSGNTNQYAPGTVAGDAIIRVETGKLVFTVDAGTSSLMALKGSNVGIGVTTPAVPLQVAGNMTVSNIPLASATYDSVSFSVATQELNPSGVFFRPDGLKMYVVGYAADKVQEYTLTTAWDVSTASSTASFSVGPQDGSPVDLYFRADGRRMYVVGQGNDSVYQYSLSRAWSVASASYDASYSVTTEETSPSGVFFSPDGLSMYVNGPVSDKVFQYTLTTAWSVTTASLTTSFSVAAQETASSSLCFSLDGTRMFVLGTTQKAVQYYNLSTAWNVSTAVFVNSFSVSTQEATPVGVYIKPDGSKMYIVGLANRTVYQYSVPYTTTNLTGALNINGPATINQNLTVYGASSAYGFSAVGSGGLGYGTGSGGAVTQATSRTTGVTLNNTNGAITLVSAAGSATYQTFTVTNSTVAATDTIIVNQKSGADKYIILITNVSAGSFAITFATTGGTTTEQPVFNFAVIKAVTA